MARITTVTRNSVAAILAVALVFAGDVSASASTPTGAVKAATTVHVALKKQPAFTPKISGKAAVGLTLKVTGQPKGATISYVWKRNGVAISGATRSTYTVAKADLGKKLTVAVTSKRAGYTKLTKTSASTAKVVKRFTAYTPKISGTAKVGSKLKATTTAWSPKPTFTYQWYRNGVAIKGATASTRTLSAADAGAKITVKLTGRKSGYLTTSKTSAATAKVAKATTSATKPPVTTPPSTTPPTTTPPTTDASAFPVGARIDYQLGGAYTPPAGVGIVTRDASASPAAGVWNICYINGFQTQPGARWDSSLVLTNSSGKQVGDPNWPGEYLLDTSTAAKRSAIAAVLAKTVDSCATKGFDAVEFDNLDSYTRSGKLLTADNNVAMAKLLVDLTHNRGMLAGQKNTVELSKRLRAEAGFDFAVAEECLEYSECTGYTNVYGNKTLDIEYSDGSLTLAQVCKSSQLMPSTVYRDRDLVAKGKSGYVYGTCS